ncbi:MAG: 3-dehydroquinate synthase [Propionibacteriaceae bacterium]
MTITRHGDLCLEIGIAVGQRRVLLVTDETVNDLHGQDLNWTRIVLPVGEAHKTFTSVEKIHQACLAAGLDRSSVIVAMGGGLICDVAAFAASTWMRGIPVILAPTTLLSQVDAAHGGKTALNVGGIKNVAGTFHPAEAVVISPQVLTTLSPTLLADGMAELIKHGIIADYSFIELLERDLPEPLAPAAIAPWLPTAVGIKAAFVAEDPHEHGSRMLLNFGHTLGHAIEATTDLSHGRSVAIGMVAATRLSVNHGWLSDGDSERIVSLLARAGLPTSAAGLDRSQLISAMTHDKKNRGDQARIIILESLGSARILETDKAIFEELVDAVL